uniref:Uncharacterized protein n=1 Tax=Mola mola TaxID=94237 RepID=A0A3Q4AQB0_MOLML
METLFDYFWCFSNVSSEDVELKRCIFWNIMKIYSITSCSFCIRDEKALRRNTFVNILFSEFIFSAVDSEREENQEAYSRRGPLPDLLPQNEHPFWVSPHHRIPTEGAVQYRPAGYRRMARRLRAIGDELNDTVLRRHAVPHWQDWRDACRGLLNFIAQTLSTLYRLT